MKKRIGLICILAFMISILAGCNTSMDFSMKDDFSGKMTETILLTADEVQKFELEKSFEALNPDKDGNVATRTSNTQLQITDEEIDGVTYKKMTETITFDSPQEFEESLMDIMSLQYNENYFCMSTVAAPTNEKDLAMAQEQLESLLGSDNNMQNLATALTNAKATMTATFPFDIIEANGTVSEDKKTVSWTQDDTVTRFYAIFKENKSINPPVITGAKNNKYYQMPVILDIDSETLLKSVDVNGLSALSGKVVINNDGAYTITATDSSDKSTVLNFTIDTQKPIVKGVKNNKVYKNGLTITFKDKTSGIKKATLNGKAVATGTKVKKSGSYTLQVTDKAGNKKTVKFKVK